MLGFRYLIRRWFPYGIYSLEKVVEWIKVYLENLSGFLFGTPLAPSVANEFAWFCMGGTQTWNGVKIWLGVFLHQSSFELYLKTYNFVFAKRRTSTATGLVVLKNLRKKSSRGVLKKRCSENKQQIYRRTPMPKCFIEITFRHGCSPVNSKFLNTSVRLFLNSVIFEICFW